VEEMMTIWLVETNHEMSDESTTNHWHIKHRVDS